MEVGKVIIKKEALQDIVIQTVEDFNGIVCLTKKNVNAGIIFDRLKSLDFSSKSQDIDIELSDTECVLEFSVIIEYGNNVVDLLDEFEKVLIKNIESMTNIKLRELTVNVSGIVKKDKE